MEAGCGPAAFPKPRSARPAGVVRSRARQPTGACCWRMPQPSWASPRPACGPNLPVSAAL